MRSSMRVPSQRHFDDGQAGQARTAWPRSAGYARLSYRDRRPPASTALNRRITRKLCSDAHGNRCAIRSRWRCPLRTRPGGHRPTLMKIKSYRRLPDYRAAEGHDVRQTLRVDRAAAVHGATRRTGRLRPHFAEPDDPDRNQCPARHHEQPTELPCVAPSAKRSPISSPCFAIS
jgi:hypothetical protein